MDVAKIRFALVAPEIKGYDPENSIYWRKEGQKIAYSNLTLVSLDMFTSYVIWQIWPPIVPYLNKIGYNFSDSALFWLTSIPALSGSTFRLIYIIIYGEVSNRKFTIVSTALTIFAVLVGIMVLLMRTASNIFLLTAIISSGLAGGYFAIALPYITYFFPKRMRGRILGFAAGAGNIGISIAHFSVAKLTGLKPFAGPHYLTDTGKPIAPQNALFFWLIPSIICFFMALIISTDLINQTDNFNQKPKLCDCTSSSCQCIYKTRFQKRIKRFGDVLRNKHIYAITFIYISAYGTLLGISVALPLVVNKIFGRNDSYQITWIPPFLGAVLRPIGGILADKVGISRTINACFFSMAIVGMVIIISLPNSNSFSLGMDLGSFPMFITAASILVGISGIINGAITAIIPVVYNKINIDKAGETVLSQNYWKSEAIQQSSIVLGLTTAFVGYGGFILPKLFGLSIVYTGGIEMTIHFLIACFILNLVVNSYFYGRKSAEIYC